MCILTSFPGHWGIVLEWNILKNSFNCLYTPAHIHSLQWAMNRPCLYLYFNFTHSSMVVTFNVYCTYVPTPSLLISLTLLAGYSKRQVCVWPFVPYMCAVLELVPGNTAYCMTAVFKLPCGIRTHSCGCGAHNEVSELIGRWQYALMWYV